MGAGVGLRPRGAGHAGGAGGPPAGAGGAGGGGRARGGEVVREGAEEGAVILATGVAGLGGAGVKGQAALLRLPGVEAGAEVYAGGIYVVPHADGTVAVGSTAEKNWGDPTATDERLEAVIAKARALIPALGEAPRGGAVGGGAAPGGVGAVVARAGRDRGLRGERGIPDGLRHGAASGALDGGSRAGRAGRDPGGVPGLRRERRPPGWRGRAGSPR